MKMPEKLIAFVFAVVISGCTASKKTSATVMPAINTVNVNILDSLLQAHPQYFKEILANKDNLHVQVLYTKIDRDKNNVPHFTDYQYHVDTAAYFYPASTVKMPVAFLALEKLNQLNIAGLDKNTAMVTESNSKDETEVLTHYSAADGVPSIKHYIKQIFLVSDNDAFNRLYEFMGQEEIQKALVTKGYTDAEIRNRVQISLTEEQNRHTNAVRFYDSSSKLIYHQPTQFSKATFAPRHTLMGNGYMADNKLISQPSDLSIKNKMYLGYLHNIMRSVLFPDAVPDQQRFNLSKEDYAFLYRYMSAWPKESRYPYYDSTEYYDAFGKFLLLGSQKTSPPPYIRIFNKPGDAYGFLTDIAYIVDFKNNVEFMLSATIYCNSDGIFNDDKYDYDKLGYPFMQHLGEVIYTYELQRSRAFTPDLSTFKIDYSKEY